MRLSAINELANSRFVEMESRVHGYDGRNGNDLLTNRDGWVTTSFSRAGVLHHATVRKHRKLLADLRQA